jgi:hypothetical protein
MLQVFSANGAHLCTRDDLGLHDSCAKGITSGIKAIAWSTAGELAIANSSDNNVLVWGV